MSRKILKYVNFEPQNKIAINTGADRGNRLDTTANHNDSVESDVHQPQSTADQAAAILTEAQQKAEAILQQAQAQIADWQEEARQQGWEAGYSAGQEAAREESRQTLVTINQALVTAEMAKDEFIASIQDSIGELAVDIAEKIIGKEITQNSQAVTNIVGKVLEAANVHGACTIRVNPLDYEILGPLWDTIPSMQSPTQKWEMVPDKRIEQGGCIIEANGGIIDAQLGTQLKQIKKSFKSIGRNSAGTQKTASDQVVSPDASRK